ncbi:MAG: hypothetical protein HDQ91_04910 [Desulfovibrio sp.]|nr:hypothetical protein [Desulfovibrio sp.]
MATQPGHDLVAKTQKLPRPRPEKAGSLKTALLALLCLLILACAGYWLTLSSDRKEAYRELAADHAASLLADTPFASLANLLRPAKPQLPEQLLRPATEKGTLSGQTVTGTIAAPPDFGESSATAPAEMNGQGGALPLPGLLAPGQTENQVVFSQEPLQPVAEDSRIKAAYLTSLAQWLANHYRTGSQGGLAANVQALNQECGVRLANQAQGGRSGILRYAFHPSMINGLYRLYIDRFMADLNEAAIRKGFNPDQNRQFHRAMAGRAAILASSLAGVLQVPDLPARLAQIDSLAQKTVDANAELTTAVFELDAARSGRASRQALAAGQMRVDGATARYRRASEEHTRAQDALAAEIRRHSGQNADEDSLLFLAAWVGRRYAQGGNAKGAIESCITALRDFSNRCARFGEGA